jgi:hypothetical protein
MADKSDEQTWWSDLFTDGADPGLAIPDDLWESVVATALDVDAPAPTDDLTPADQTEIYLDGLDGPSGFHDDVGHPWTHSDAPGLDDASLADEAHHHGGDHEIVYDGPHDDLTADDADTFDDQL